MYLKLDVSETELLVHQLSPDNSYCLFSLIMAPPFFHLLTSKTLMYTVFDSLFSLISTLSANPFDSILKVCHASLSLPLQHSPCHHCLSYRLLQKLPNWVSSSCLRGCDQCQWELVEEGPLFRPIFSLKGI